MIPVAVLALIEMASAAIAAYETAQAVRDLYENVEKYKLGLEQASPVAPPASCAKAGSIRSIRHRTAAKAASQRTWSSPSAAKSAATRTTSSPSSKSSFKGTESSRRRFSITGAF